MKHTPATTVKFSKALKKIHNLKVKKLNDDILFSALSDIYSDVELLFDMYNKNKLTDKEKAILVEVKKEKVAQKVRESYKKKLRKKEIQLNKIMSPRERSNIGYLKFNARKELNKKVHHVADVKFNAKKILDILKP
tara:strand:- start:79 stop:486 length:408 start_codon:yes stop_codon:yes gene_type:complete